MKFKKILKRAAISISVLLLIFKGVLMYRDYTSYKDVIHKNANQIVKVRVDGIFQSIVFNAIKNPSYYLKKDSKKESEDDKKSDDKGVSVPANLFLYTLNNYSKTTVFTSFKISDSSAFKNFITSKFKFKNFKSSQTITNAFTKDKKIQIAYMKHIERMLSLAGIENAIEKASNIYEIEKILASNSMTRVDCAC